MTGFPKFNVGEHVTASKLNSLADYAGIAERSTYQQAGSFFGSQSGNAIPEPPVYVRNKQVFLCEDLMAAVKSLYDPSTAQAHVLRRKADGDFELTDEEITIVNRFLNISVDGGTYCKAEWIDGEWQLYAADCPGGSVSQSESC